MSLPQAVLQPGQSEMQVAQEQGFIMLEGLVPSRACASRHQPIVMVG